MKILAISDIEVNFIYSPSIARRFRDVSFVVSCGDLPYSYLEYIISMLNVPLYYVHGNHDGPERRASGDRIEPWGGILLHERCQRDPSGLLLAGLDGSLRYNKRPDYQFTQSEYWSMALKLAPVFLLNLIRYGHSLDILVTHAPSWGILDGDDLPHQGIKAFRWLAKVFKPALHLHGHVHLYGANPPNESAIGKTRVVNVYGYREITL